MAEENIIEESRKRLEEYCKRLEGIGYFEWEKLKSEMDFYFRRATCTAQWEMKFNPKDLDENRPAAK